MSHKQKIWSGIFSLVLLAVLLHFGGIEIVPTASAQFGGGVQPRGTLGESMVSLVQKLGFLNTVLHVMLLVILNMLQYLLQSDFFTDPVMMGALNTIWQLARDIMNVIFALLLIGVSFYTIITAKTDFIKEKMRNFVVAVILVNFSWFFPRVIIDVANVLTATAFSIPNMIPNFTCTTLDDSIPPQSVPCKVISDVIIFPSPQAATNFCGAAAVNSPSCPCISGIECHKIEDFNTAVTHMSSAHAMINGLVVSFVKIANLAKIPTTLAVPGPIGVGQAAAVSLQVAFSVALAVAIQLSVVLPLLGLGVGLLLRILILWVTTAFMPFSFLGYVVSGKLGTNVFGFEVDIWKEFINAAFLPAVIAIPFVIGFIMLSTVAQIPAPLGAFPQTWNVPLLSGVTSWWALLWMFAAIAIIWSGSFKALQRSAVVGKFTEKIRGFGEYIFGGVIRLPLLAQLPMPGGRSPMTVASIVNTPKMLSDAVRASTSGYGNRSFNDVLREMSGGTRGNPNTLATELSAGRENTNKLLEALRDLKTASGTERQNKISIIQQITGSTGSTPRQTLELLRDIGNKQGVAGAIGSKLKDINDEVVKEGGTRT